MKKTCFIIIMLLYNFAIFAQVNDTNKYKDPQNMDVVMQQEAHYPGGEAELTKFINNNIVFSDEVKNDIISKDILMSFIVMPDSTLADLTFISGTGEESIDIQIMKLFSKLKYAPSIQNGVNIKMNMIITLPIRLKRINK